MTLPNWISRGWMVGGMIAVLSGGCAGAGSDPTQPDQLGHEQDSSGQTGSIAPSQCQHDQDCVPFAEQLIQDFNTSAPPPALRGANCTKVGTAASAVPGASPGAEEVACVCALDDGSSYTLGTGTATSCPLSRLGSCLYEGAEFPGCALGEPSATCQAICTEVQTRRAADAARALNAKVRETRCSPTGTTYSCEFSFEIEGSCYDSLLPRNMVPHECQPSAASN